MSSHRQCGAQGPPFSQRARTETESMNVLPWDSPVGPRWAAPGPAVNMSGRQSNTKRELARASLLTPQGRPAIPRSRADSVCAVPTLPRKAVDI